MKARRSASPSRNVLFVLVLFAPLFGSSSVDASAAASITGLPESGTLFGVVTNFSNLSELETGLGRRVDIVKIYQAFWHGHFWTDFANPITNGGRLEFLSFDPNILDDQGTERPLTTCDVLPKAPGDLGLYDQAIAGFAAEVKAWGKPLWISTAGEMNAYWQTTPETPYGWKGDANFGPNCDQTYETTDNPYKYYGCADARPECLDGPERYRDMYRRIHDIASFDPKQVAWVWVVNHASVPDAPWNALTSYYPGDTYVDIIAVDGYNWADEKLGGWKSFDQVFGQALALIRAAYPSKPVIIGETASADGKSPEQKAGWLWDAFRAQIKPHWRDIHAVIYFDDTKNGAPTFPLHSSPESFQSMGSILQDCLFGSEGICPYDQYLPGVGR